MNQNSFSELKKKIQSKKSKVGIIGLGYVGLPLAVSFGQAGFNVVGIDISKNKISMLKKKKSPVQGVTDDEVSDLVSSKKLTLTSDYSKIASLDVVIVCVPTPLSKSWDPDLSFIISATLAIAQNFKKGQLIVLESTTYPGTTEEVLLSEFQQNGLKVGKDFYLCFSPERIDPGNIQYGTTNIPKVVGGVTPKCSELAEVLYGQVVTRVVKVSSPKVAEMAKLLENTFRIVNIGLVNELAKASKELNIDIWEVIEAASTKPFGFMPFFPGPGIGGHCIGVDPMYLSWKAKFHGQELRFIELARQVNSSMPQFVVEKVAQILNEKGKSIKKSKIMMLGVAYKKNIDDVRESPAFEIIETLSEKGANISYHDPYVPQVFMDEKKITSKSLTQKNLHNSDLVIIATDHDNVPYDSVVKHSKLIFDTRNVLEKNSIRSKKIIKL